MFESAELGSQPGLILVVYTAAPGSSSADALALLGSLAAGEHVREASVEPPLG